MTMGKVHEAGALYTVKAQHMSRRYNALWGRNGDLNPLLKFRLDNELPRGRKAAHHGQDWGKLREITHLKGNFSVTFVECRLR